MSVCVWAGSADCQWRVARHPSSQHPARPDCCVKMTFWTNMGYGMPRFCCFARPNHPKNAASVLRGWWRCVLLLKTLWSRFCALSQFQVSTSTRANLRNWRDILQIFLSRSNWISSLDFRISRKASTGYSSDVMHSYGWLRTNSYNQPLHPHSSFSGTAAQLWDTCWPSLHWVLKSVLTRSA